MKITELAAKIDEMGKQFINFTQEEEKKYYKFRKNIIMKVENLLN